MQPVTPARGAQLGIGDTIIVLENFCKESYLNIQEIFLSAFTSPQLHRHLIQNQGRIVMTLLVFWNRRWIILIIDVNDTGTAVEAG